MWRSGVCRLAHYFTNISIIQQQLQAIYFNGVERISCKINKTPILFIEQKANGMILRDVAKAIDLGKGP